MTTPYDLRTPPRTRSISFENPTGEPGAGGRAASPLGVGRKGLPAKFLEAGERVTLCDVAGPGVIRHVWVTTRNVPEVMRALVVRAWWDDQPYPSIECPLGDLFGFAHGWTPHYESEVHSVGERGALNLWLPMPFGRRARIELENPLSYSVPVFYQIDYTIGDAIDEAAGRLHVSFRRENPTTLRRDFAVMPDRHGGPGRYLGAVIGVRPMDPRWWGEGEFKVYLDSDGEFPTIVGTGAEDYACISFCIQPTPFRYHGVNWREGDDVMDTGRVSMYRWHLPDPITWRTAIRATIQQIGLNGSGAASLAEYHSKLYERADDWSAAAFWYEVLPSAPLPPLPSLEERVADLPIAPGA